MGEAFRSGLCMVCSCQEAGVLVAPICHNLAVAERLDTLKQMQRIMATHDRRVMDVNLARLIDDRFVRALDEMGAITRMYARYGIDRKLRSTLRRPGDVNA